MKKVLSITIALCLVFGSIFPVYADAWTSNQASNVTIDVDNIELHTRNIYQYLRDFLLSYNSGQTSNWTFGDLYWEVHRMATWIAPIGSNDGSYETLWSVLMNIAIDTRSYLPHIPTIATYVVNWMSDNNTHLSRLENALSNMFSNSGSLNYALNAHSQIPFASNAPGWYSMVNIDSNGESHLNGNYFWGNGSPIGNLALMLWNLTDNQAKVYGYRWVADLKHYNDNLTTWDSQGDTLEQVPFTPESAIQGLYRYLAFTQRDVARLTYVMASDEEITAREKARETQTAVLDNFIDPEGNSSVTDTDIGGMSDLASGFKDNFSTGQSAGNVFSIFNNGSSTNWFSTATKNALDTTQTRSFRSAGSSTPLLDAYYEEIMTYFPGGDQE